MPAFVPSHPEFTPGVTVRCNHDTDQCPLCKAGKPQACGYYKTVGVTGTVLRGEAPGHRSRWVYGEWVNHIMVAFIGHDRPSIIPVTEVELQDVSVPDMCGKWQVDMDEVSSMTNYAMTVYDAAPDGSKKKHWAQGQFEYLSNRRSLIEKAFDVLVDLYPEETEGKDPIRIPGQPTPPDLAS